MRASRYWPFVLIAAIFSQNAAFAAEPVVRPNVVFILADDLGWADLGCYGSKYHKTPNLDRLAAGSARFTNAYAAACICSPTRAAILTGKYPARLGITDWLPGRTDRPDQKMLRAELTQALPASEITLAAAFKAAGYTTGHVGKWHLGDKTAKPRDRGFDFSVSGHEPDLTKVPQAEYQVERLTAAAEKFIEANRDKPFFLYLAHDAVHIPLKAKPELVAKYKAGAPGSQGNPLYAAMLESLDDGVGSVLKKLDVLKLTDRTIVIFTSDNGGLSVFEGPNTPATSNSPLREGKGYLYEGGLRVPLIVNVPGVTKPGTIDTPVHSIDFFATLLEACDVKSEAKPDGVSLLPLLKGEALKREYLCWHYPHYSNQGGRPGSAIRAGDYKLIEFFENGRRELFDVEKDPGESRNLIDSNKEIAKELTEKLDRWRKEVGAKRMEPNPDYVPNPQDEDGSVLLHSKAAEVHGTMLRFEPLPHKNTLGYWVRTEDWASWEFSVTKPGTFAVEILQGCGKGQGGSEVEVSIGEQVLKFTVEDTGHFQNFKAREVGTVTLDKPGRYTLTVKTKKKAAGAVMDLRSIALKYAAK